MLSRRRMIGGAILMLVAIGIFAFALVMIGEEADLLNKAVRFDGGAAGAAGRGDLVIVEGRVSAKNKILMHDFVDAAKEYQDGEGSWPILEEYRQPILADLARGEIILTADKVCRGAKGNNVLENNERTTSGRKIHYIGLKRGDPITATGTLTSLDPASLAVKHWYSGSVADHKSFLTSSRTGVYIFCGLLFVLGAAFFLWGIKPRWSSPTSPTGGVKERS